MNPNSFDLPGLRYGACLRALCLSIVFVWVVPVAATAATDLAEMSLEELMGIEVTSVSKKAQSKTSAAAAITVITAEDIRRGGFTVIPEALRSVPGLQIARVDANRWAISVRGSTGLFANKLLVLIDGRSVYTPVFGGTYWDAVDYPIEDVERIEVIRGPGGTIWGANAVNGVINIITKNAKDTQGSQLVGYGGSHEYGLTGRYGGSIGDDTHYRVYARGFQTEDFDINKDHDGHDEWRQARFGARIDSQLSDSDTLRISADFYMGDNEQGFLNPLGVPTFLDIDAHQRGGNILVNWNRKLSGDSDVQVKAYYSLDDREFHISEVRHNADIEVQYNFSLMQNVAVSLGGNYRYSANNFGGTVVGFPLSFTPDDEEFHLASGFGQVQADFFDDRLTLIVGTKLGYNSWSDFEFQPSGRVVVTPTEGHVIWGAISRAVRTPTEAERDLSFTLPPNPPNPFPTILVGDRSTRSEELLAFELGYRFFALERFSMEIALFWNEYESASSFRVIGPLPPPVVNLKFANQNELTVRGVEVEVNVLPAPWWRLKLAYSYLHMDEDLGPTAVSFGKLKDDNPQHQFNVQSLFELPMDIEFDVSVYYVDGVPGTVPTAQPKNVEQYVRLDLRLGYRPTDWAEIALVGRNLTDRRHYESSDFTLGQSTQVPRSGLVKVTLDF